MVSGTPRAGRGRSGGGTRRRRRGDGGPRPAAGPGGRARSGRLHSHRPAPAGRHGFGRTRPPALGERCCPGGCAAGVGRGPSPAPPVSARRDRRGCPCARAQSGIRPSRGLGAPSRSTERSAGSAGLPGRARAGTTDGRPTGQAAHRRRLPLTAVRHRSAVGVHGHRPDTGRVPRGRVRPVIVIRDGGLGERGPRPRRRRWWWYEGQGAVGARPRPQRGRCGLAASMRSLTAAGYVPP